MLISLKLLKLGEIDGVKVFASKYCSVKFWTKLMSDLSSQEPDLRRGQLRKKRRRAKIKPSCDIFVAQGGLFCFDFLLISLKQHGIYPTRVAMADTLTDRREIFSV